MGGFHYASRLSQGSAWVPEPSRFLPLHPVFNFLINGPSAQPHHPENMTGGLPLALHIYSIDMFFLGPIQCDYFLSNTI